MCYYGPSGPTDTVRYLLVRKNGRVLSAITAVPHGSSVKVHIVDSALNGDGLKLCTREMAVHLRDLLNAHAYDQSAWDVMAWSVQA